MDSVSGYHRTVQTGSQARSEVVSDSDWIDDVSYGFFVPACRVSDHETRFRDECPKGIGEKYHCGGKAAWQEHLVRVANRYTV